MDYVSLLGYSWKNVSSWNFDSKKKVCTIYGKDGKKLDELNLDSVIKDYIGNLSEDDITESLVEFLSEEGENKIELN